MVHHRDNGQSFAEVDLGDAAFHRAHSTFAIDMRGFSLAFISEQSKLFPGHGKSDRFYPGIIEFRDFLLRRILDLLVC